MVCYFVSKEASFMFVVLVISCFLGLVVLPVIFLLDPLEVKTKAATTLSDEHHRRATDKVRLPSAEDHRTAVSGAK